jgi:hypothetical protein
MKDEAKTPLQDKSLRYVAQFADKAIDGIVNDRLLG